MKNITTTFLNDLEKRLDKLKEKELNSLVEKLNKKQPYLTAFCDATEEIFEDETDYLDLLNYFFLLINDAFEQTYGNCETIPPELIEITDNKHVDLLEKLEGSEDFEEKIIELFDKHEQSDLIYYIYDSIFHDEIDYDDKSLELSTQLAIFAYTIIDIYSIFYQTSNSKK